MIRFSFLPLYFIFIIFAFGAKAQEDIFEQLKEVPAIKKEIENEDKNYNGAYAAVFSQGSKATNENYIAGILEYISIFKTVEFDKVESKKNNIDIIASNLLNIQMKGSIKNLEPDSKKRKKYVQDFLEILDIRGSGDGYSGMPFINGLKNFFKKKENLENMLLLAKAVEEEAKKAAQAYLNGSKDYIPTTFFTLMAQTYKASNADYIRMGGFLLSRDVSLQLLLNQLKDFNSDLPEHRKVSLIPLYLRLITEIDQSINKIAVDRVSYGEGIQSILKKNYYFWSGSYIFTELLERGVPVKIATQMVGTFPLIYKKIRSYSSVAGKLNLAVVAAGAATIIYGLYGEKPSLYWIGVAAMMGAVANYFIIAQNFTPNMTNKSDTYQVTRLSMKGAKFSEQQITIEPCDTFFNKDELR